MFIPKLFTYQSGPHKAALLQTLLLTSWETKMLQWEYDPSDGEVRAMVEFPLEDAPLTERQFFRAFDGLLHLSVRFHPRLKQVIESGEDPGRAEPGAGADSEWGAFLRGGGGDDGGGAPDAL